MSFIKSYGVSLPHFRVDDSVLNINGNKSFSKAVCFSDEDIITLAFQAAKECINGDENKIDAIFFATTSPVFKNRYHATFIADLLGLKNINFSLDFIGTDRSGTDAILVAHQLVNSGKNSNILIIATDVRYSSIGEEISTNFGHGACAITVSDEKGIAEIKDTFHVSSFIAEEFTYKNNEVKYDPRYIRDEGFKKNMIAVSAKVQKYIGETEKNILNSKYFKMAIPVFAKSGFNENQFSVDAISPSIGNTGVASAFFRLISEIENQTKNILLIDYSNGSNVLYINLKDFTNKTILKRKLENFEKIKTYQDFLKLRKSGNFNSAKYKSVDIFSSEMMNNREKDSFIRLEGTKCNACQTIYLIKTQRCKKCKSENFIKTKISENGKVYTFTSEHYFPATFPPVTMIVANMKNGGRITLQQTDCMYPEDNKIEIGSEVKLVLRKMTEFDSNPDYFLKAIVKK
ncbi:MAG: hypothetical protein HUU47_04120 [Bacteroidetes bacterium]|nr:hypothetical protein [Bacteroidota bacterium]